MLTHRLHIPTEEKDGQVHLSVGHMGCRFGWPKSVVMEDKRDKGCGANRDATAWITVLVLAETPRDEFNCEKELITCVVSRMLPHI